MSKKLIVGLGNPGKEYENTRHNVGFLALDRIKDVFGFEEFRNDKKFQGLVNKGKINKTATVLLKPETFMNNSGFSVKATMNFLKIEPKNVIVVHDDKDIPLGETRVQSGRGSAGHNGVESIVEQIGTNEFTRIRVGIAPPDGKIADTSDFVLDKFRADETTVLKNVLNNITEEIKGLV